MDEVVKRIVDVQNRDGGWGFSYGRSSNTESTSLCLMALESLGEERPAANINRALDWLMQRQRPEGSWPLSDSSMDDSWTTAVAIIALSRFPKYRERTVRAAHWLLKQEGRRPGVLAQLISAFAFNKTVVALNPDLKGWPWGPRTFSWVEPTSYALIALKQIRSYLVGTNVEERIHQGELMIYDRMCDGGGWNYGNSKVFGEALWPYPDVTAIALIALQDHQIRQANQDSLKALRKMIQETDSGLALSWATICLSLYGDETEECKRRIKKHFQKTGFLGETKTLALSLIAVVNHAKSFRV
jgi:Squalene-hopene cyclase C-terminal domain